MVSNIFIHFLNLSRIISIMILSVCIIRLLFANAPKKMRKILWAIVGIRCCLPFSLSSPIGILPNKSVTYTLSDKGIENTGVTHVASASYINNNNVSANISYNINLREFLAYIWIIGIIVFFIYTIYCYLKVKNLVADSVPFKDNIYESDKICSPFVMGYLNPKIYIKSNTDEKQRDLIISHEECHLKKHDNYLKLVSFIILAVYWFNPLIWIAHSMFCKDIELACDEEVIKSLPLDSRKNYAITLLENSHNNGSLSYGIAFGECNTKKRILNVINYKQPTFKLTVLSLGICLSVLLVFFTVTKDSNAYESSKQDIENNTLYENPEENPGFFETDCISLKYNSEKFYGFKVDDDFDTIVLNSLTAVAGTSLIQISKTNCTTIDSAANEIAKSTGFELTPTEHYDFNGYNAVFTKHLLPDSPDSSGVVIDNYYIIAEKDSTVIVIEQLVTYDPDTKRAKALKDEFSSVINTIRFK